MNLLLAPPLAYPPHAPPSAQPLSGFYLAYLASNSGDMPFRFVVELLGDFCGLYYFTNVLLQLSIAGGALTKAEGLGLWGVGRGGEGKAGPAAGTCAIGALGRPCRQSAAADWCTSFLLLYWQPNPAMVQTANIT